MGGRAPRQSPNCLGIRGIATKTPENFGDRRASVSAPAVFEPALLTLPKGRTIMSILNTLLGDTTVDTGNTQAGAAVATNPELGLQLSDVLQAGSTDSGSPCSPALAISASACRLRPWLASACRMTASALRRPTPRVVAACSAACSDASLSHWAGSSAARRGVHAHLLDPWIRALISPNAAPRDELRAALKSQWRHFAMAVLAASSTCCI